MTNGNYFVKTIKSCNLKFFNRNTMEQKSVIKYLEIHFFFGYFLSIVYRLFFDCEFSLFFLSKTKVVSNFETQIVFGI